MSNITYFQKYSQKENHVTNNTLLMFRYLYQHNRSGFEGLLKNITGGGNLDVGVVFKQQVSKNHSVPDGVISQKSFSIYIEAKLTGKLSESQIDRHLESAQKDAEVNKGSGYIIGLTKDKMSKNDLEKYCKKCRDGGVIFAAITYLEIVEFLRGEAKENDYNLMEAIDDYEKFLRSHKLISGLLSMVSFPCRISIKENVDYGIYYEPSGRPDKSDISYLGMYANKEIKYFASIKKSVCAKYKNGRLEIEDEVKSGEGKVSENDKQEIIKIINASKYYPNLGSEDIRYYLLDDIQEVNIKKMSPYGLQGKKYFDLREFSEEVRVGMDNEKIADLIRGKTFGEK